MLPPCFCWASTPTSSVPVYVCVCLRVCSSHHTSLSPRISPVKSFVLTRSSLYPLLNLFFMLPSLNLMGLAVCLSVASSQPYHAPSEMTFREPVPVFPLSSTGSMPQNQNMNLNKYMSGVSGGLRQGQLNINNNPT